MAEARFAANVGNIKFGIRALKSKQLKGGRTSRAGEKRRRSPDMPRRPTNALGFYSRFCRDNGGPKTQTDRAKAFAMLSEEDRAPFLESAKKSKEEYFTAKAAWLEKEKLAAEKARDEAARQPKRVRLNTESEDSSSSSDSDSDSDSDTEPEL